MNISWSCNVSGVRAALGAKAAEIAARMPAGIARGGEIVCGSAKAKCPVDTGHLRASIESKAEGLSATVGTNVEYGIYQEFGTYKMAAQPYLRPALTESSDAVVAAVRAAIGL